MRPFPTYHHLYPLPPERIANLAYFFRYGYADGRRCETYMADTIKRVARWKSTAAGALFMDEGDEGELLILDTRLGRSERRFELRGLERELYELCADIHSRATLLEHARHAVVSGAGEPPPGQAIEPWLDAFLDRMTSDLLMLREGEQYLSLAVNPALDRRARRAALAAALAALS